MRITALVAAVVLLALAAARWLRRSFVAVEVAGESMSPALRSGEYLLLRRGGVPRGERAYGEIVALRDASGRLLLKRVVGLPGESVRAGEEVQINGRVLEEPYANGATSASQYRGVQRLTEGEHFLLGDRRDASTDSRDFGPIDRSRMEGVAKVRYWPPSRVGLLSRPPRRFVEPRPVSAPGG
jgi:signal peptidase I